MSNDFIHCDDEFEIVEEDLDMAFTNLDKAKQPWILPDISREIEMLDDHYKDYSDKRIFIVGAELAKISDVLLIKLED